MNRFERFDTLTDDEIMDKLAKELRGRLGESIDYGYDATEKEFFFSAPKYSKCVYINSKYVRGRRWDIIIRSTEALEEGVREARREVNPMFKEIDNALSAKLAEKSNGRLSLYSCKRGFYGSPVNRKSDGSFYCWGDDLVNNTELSVTYMPENKVSAGEWEELSRMFVEKYGE